MSTNIAEKLKAAKDRAETVTKRQRPQAYQLSADETDPIKVLIFGHSGTGKTFFLVGLLLNGERVIVLSSDAGNNGLMTVKNELRRRGRLDLLKNVLIVDVATYDDVIAFLDNPVEFVPGINEFDPTVLVWEGFSSFNIDILDEYILSMAPGAENAGEMRHEGWTHTKQDFQGIKRGTMRAIRKFLAAVLPSGKRLSKILTCLESKPQVNDLTQRTERGPLVHGTGRDLMNVGFDVIMEAFREETKDGVVTFNYRCSGSSEKFVLKNRGFDLKPVEPADPERIWKVLSTQSTV